MRGLFSCPILLSLCSRGVCFNRKQALTGHKMLNKRSKKKIGCLNESIDFLRQPICLYPADNQSCVENDLAITFPRFHRSFIPGDSKKCCVFMVLLSLFAMIVYSFALSYLVSRPKSTSAYLGFIIAVDSYTVRRCARRLTRLYWIHICVRSNGFRFAFSDFIQFNESSAIYCSA